MIVTEAAWDAKNAAMAKRPIFVLTIEGQAIVYTTHDLAAEGITGTLPAYEAWLKTPDGSTQSIDVQAGTSSIGEISCELVDVGGAVRTFVGTTTLEGAMATLSVGYPGIAYTEFAVLCAHRIYKVLPNDSYNGYVVSARDIQMDAKRTIWKHPTNGADLSAENPWIIQGTPAEIIQQIWLMGLGNSPDGLDLAILRQLDDPAEGYYAACRPFLFQLDQPFQVKQFLEEQVYKASGMYPVVTNDGKLSVRGFRPFAAGPAPVFAFTADNCVALPQIDRASILNDLKWEFDNRGTYGNPDLRSKLLFLDATSIGTFGRSNERQVSNNGLRTELGAQWFAQMISQRMFGRFAGSAALRGGAPIVSVESMFLTLPVWTGDYVSLSHPLMPDLFTGAKGVTDRVFEVIDRTPSYSSGRMNFKLLDTGLTGAPAAATWGSFVVGTTKVY